MSENESMYGTTLSQESIKVIAESIGVGNFPDEAAKDLAEEVSYRLKETIQVSILLYILCSIIEDEFCIYMCTDYIFDTLSILILNVQVIKYNAI